jgi:hypothetical protein
VKKFYTISLTFLFLLAGVHLTIAIHYCGGRIAASKISVSGELASCGMESTENKCSQPGDHLKAHCCDDEVSVCAIDNNYTPTVLDLTDISQKIIQVFSLPVVDKIYSFISSNTLLTSFSPPGRLFTSAVSLIDICVFRN